MRSIRKKQSIYLLLLITVLSTFLIISCEKEEKEPDPSMEQIQEKEGLTVEVTPVEKSVFQKKLSLFAKLSGIKESTKSSMVGDRILKIRGQVGSRVGAGSVVVQFPSDNPALQYTQAKTALENAEKTYKRMQELVKAGETAQQNLDNTEAQYLVNKRNFESIKQMIFVESPISGTIIKMDVEQGDVVKPGDPLFTVAQTHIMKAEAWVSEDEINLIKRGMEATMEFAGKEYTGKVTEVGLAMDDKKRAFKIVIQFKNRKGELKSGVSTDIYITTYENPDVISISRNLVRRDGDKKYVYVANSDKAKKKYIETGEESGINVEVLSGLTPGDKLITKGQALVEDGTKLKINK